MKGLAPDFRGITKAWNVTSVPSLSEYVRKKVILLLFWNANAPSSLRALRTAERLYQKYRSVGLEVLGVYAPEFFFDENPAHVAMVAKLHGVSFPILFDQHHETSETFASHFWPRLVVINIEGAIVCEQVGERNWQATEDSLHQALLERSLLLGTHQGVVSPAPRHYEHVPDQQIHTFAVRSIAGRDWHATDEFLESRSRCAALSFEYNGGELYLLAASPRLARISIRIDGSHPGRHRTLHLDGGGYAAIEHPVLTHVLHDVPQGAHEVELSVDAPAVRLYRAVFER